MEDVIEHALTMATCDDLYTVIHCLFWVHVMLIVWRFDSPKHGVSWLHDPKVWVPPDWFYLLKTSVISVMIFQLKLQFKLFYFHFSVTARLQFLKVNLLNSSRLKLWDPISTQMEENRKVQMTHPGKWRSGDVKDWGRLKEPKVIPSLLA